jgi:hypothetical protein
MKRIGLFVVIAAIVAGCAVYSLVEPRPTAIGGVYTVDPQIPWSSTTAGKWEIWTVDGASLQSIEFLNGLEDGEALRVKPEEKHPRFRKTMTANEVMEFVGDTFWAAGFQKVNALNLRPEKFGGTQGFRFEMTYFTRTGLEKQAMVAGAVLKERLYLIFYTGTREHYYAKYKAHAERIIQSVQLK